MQGGTGGKHSKLKNKSKHAIRDQNKQLRSCSLCGDLECGHQKSARSQRQRLWPVIIQLWCKCLLVRTEYLICWSNIKKVK
jgi:hypothetical protein